MKSFTAVTIRLIECMEVAMEILCTIPDNGSRLGAALGKFLEPKTSQKLESNLYMQIRIPETHKLACVQGKAI